MRVQPFSVDIPEKEIADLGGRLRATRWPDAETVTDPASALTR